MDFSCFFMCNKMFTICLLYFDVVCVCVCRLLRKKEENCNWLVYRRVYRENVEENSLKFVPVWSPITKFGRCHRSAIEISKSNKINWNCPKWIGRKSIFSVGLMKMRALKVDEKSTPNFEFILAEKMAIEDAQTSCPQ